MSEDSGGDEERREGEGARDCVRDRKRRRGGEVRCEKDGVT